MLHSSHSNYQFIYNFGNLRSERGARSSREAEARTTGEFRRRP